VQLRANSGLDDLNTAIREANGDQGLPWVNGEWRGGRNAPPINIISDTAVAGYNVLVGRNPADLGGIGGEASTQPLVAIWPSAADCANWITDVLGDESVRTYDAGARSSRPGRGILPKHDEIVTEVRAAFEAILPSETPLNAEQLSAVSAPGIQITLDLIKRLRRLPKAEAAIAAARLAEEVAMARTIERGLYAKRVLLSGRREPNIANSPARDEIDRAISELTEEVETLVFEADVRHKLVSHTARNVLLFGEQESSRSADTESSSEAETEILEKGAVGQ